LVARAGAGHVRVGGAAARGGAQVGGVLAVDEAGVAGRDRRYRGAVDAVGRARGGHVERCLADVEVAVDVVEGVVGRDAARAAGRVIARAGAGHVRVGGAAARGGAQVGGVLAVDEAGVAGRDRRYRGAVDAVGRARGGHVERCLADVEVAVDVVEGVVGRDAARAAGRVISRAGAGHVRVGGAAARGGAQV